MTPGKIFKVYKIALELTHAIYARMMWWRLVTAQFYIKIGQKEVFDFLEKDWHFFLTFDHFQNVYNIKNNFLTYQGLISAIKSYI